MTEKVTKSKLKLGKIIQKLRKSRGLSQENFAEVLDISRTHIGHIEQGRKSPSIQLLEKVAKVLKVKTKELFS
mgnify:CR=1 FL=1